MKSRLIEALKALADPFRLRMVAILKREELAVSELAQVLDVTQPRVSHHLKTLKGCDLVRVRREGAWTFCSLMADESNNPVGGLLSAVDSWKQDLSPTNEDLVRLDQVLEERRHRSRAFFDEVADKGVLADGVFTGSGLRHQAMSMLIPPGLVVADIGCGSGYMTRVLAARAKKVVLVDHSPVMLGRAREELAGQVTAELDFREGELDDLPVGKEELDAAFVNLVLHHVPDLKRAMTALISVLRPGGLLVVSELMPHEEERLRDEHADLRLGLDPGKLASLASQAGFEQVSTELCVDRLRVPTRNGNEKLLPLFLLSATRGDR